MTAPPLTDAQRRAALEAERAQPGGGACGACRVGMEWLERQTEAALRLWGYNPARALFEVDHVQPRAGDGTNSPENLQVLCQLCHREKSRLDVHDLAKAERIGQAPAVDPETKLPRLRHRRPLVRMPGRA